MGLKYNVNEKFFDTWSDSMPYVLGYMYADGNIQYSLENRGKYIRFFSTDKDRILMTRNLMDSSHNVTIRKAVGNRKESYSLRIGSGSLYDALVLRGVSLRKSHTALFSSIPARYLAAFTLGYFDGDGCSFIERSKNGNAKKLHAIFTSGSLQFLTSLHEQLVKRLGIVGKGLCKHGSTKNCYQLRYATRDSIRIFRFMYSSPDLIELALRRKYDIFIKYFNERELGPEDLIEVLKQKGPVAK